MKLEDELEKLAVRKEKLGAEETKNGKSINHPRLSQS